MLKDVRTSRGLPTRSGLCELNATENGKTAPSASLDYVGHLGINQDI